MRMLWSFLLILRLLGGWLGWKLTRKVISQDVLQMMKGLELLCSFLYKCQSFVRSTCWWSLWELVEADLGRVSRHKISKTSKILLRRDQHPLTARVFYGYAGIEANLSTLCSRYGSRCDSTLRAEFFKVRSSWWYLVQNWSTNLMAEWDTSAIITKVLHSRPIKLFPLTRLPSQFRHMITAPSRLLELILALHRRDWHRWALRTVLLLMIFCSEKVHTNKVSWGGLCIRRWLSWARILPLWSLMRYFRLNRLAITLLIDDGNGVMILIAHGWLTSAPLRQFC